LSTPPQLLHRATSNALWLPLRRALQDGWPIHTDWESHDPRGNPRSNNGFGATGIPGPLPTYTPLTDKGRIHGRLAPDQWPSNGLILNTRLTQPDYEMLHAQLDMTEMYEWAAAHIHSNARVPFLQDTNRHGNPTLRRNHDPGALITPLVADFLEALAAVAQVTLLTPEQDAALEAALLTDDDAPDPMRPTEAFAVAQRSGIEPAQDTTNRNRATKAQTKPQKPRQ